MCKIEPFKYIKDDEYYLLYVDGNFYISIGPDDLFGSLCGSCDLRNFCTFGETYCAILDNRSMGFMTYKRFNLLTSLYIISKLKLKLWKRN